MAFLAPMARGSANVDPPSGLVPMSEYASVKNESSAAMIRSQHAAKLTPAPAAAPRTEAMMGLGRRRMANMIGCSL